MVAAINPGFTRIVLVTQGASQGASEKSGILWSWDASLGHLLHGEVGLPLCLLGSPNTAEETEGSLANSRLPSCNTRVRPGGIFKE